MLEALFAAVQYEQTRLIAVLGGLLCNQLGR